MTEQGFLAWLAPLRGGLIVSCQADEGSPLRDARIMAAMAQAVVRGGARAIRANTPEHIAAIRQVVDVPIFGIFKQVHPDSAVYITPTLDAARQVVAAGCDVLTVDATDRPRPGGESVETFIAALKDVFCLPLMADISTLAEGQRAAALGADLVATTLAGYTPYSRQMKGPDLRLIAALAAALDVPVIAEGRFATPEQVRAALDAGAFAVVVGSMITRPGHITAYFVEGMQGND